MRIELDHRLKRIRIGLLGSADDYGFNGAFIVTGPKGRLNLIISDGAGWEHVSVSVHHKDRCPTWDEMCFVKSLVWREDEWVIQFHPAESEYVNCHPYTLHLWRPVGTDFPKPDAKFVGPLKLRTR